MITIKKVNFNLAQNNKPKVRLICGKIQKDKAEDYQKNLLDHVDRDT